MSVTDARFRDYSTPDTTDRYLKPDAEDFVNQGVEYLAARQTVQALGDKKVKYTPVNGGVFNKSSECISFRINPAHNSWVDGSKTTLNLTFQAAAVKTTATAANLVSIFSYGSVQSCISRVTITCGGHIIEDISNYNRIYNAMERAYTSDQQTSSSPSFTDLYANYYGNTGQCIQGIAYAPVATLAAGRIIPVTVPISLSALLGPSARKAIPIGCLRDAIEIRFYLAQPAEVYYALDCGTQGAATNGKTIALDGTSDYRLTNCSLECKVLRYTDEAQAFLKNNIPGGVLTWDATTFVANTNTINVAEAESQILLTNTNYRDVKSVFCSTFSATPVVGATYAYVSTMPGLYRANLLVNGLPINSRDIGENNLADLNSSRAQFAANVLACQRVVQDIWEVSSHIHSYDTVYRGGYTPYTPDSKQVLSSVTGLTYLGSVPIYPPLGPDGNYTGRTTGPDQQGPFPAGQLVVAANWTVPVTPANMWFAISTLKSQDASRRLEGRDFRGTQVVVTTSKKNTAAATLTQQLSSVLVVGEKFHIDLRTGEFVRTL